MAAWPPTSCVRARFLIGSHTIPNSGIVSAALGDFDGSRAYECLGVTCHLHFWQNGSFTCHCGNTGLEHTPNKSQQTKLTVKKKILLLGFELATFRSRVRCSTNKLSRLPSTKGTSSKQHQINLRGHNYQGENSSDQPLDR